MHAFWCWSAGNEDTKVWQLLQKRHSSIDPEDVFENQTVQKDWYTSPGFGGNSKCWMVERPA